MDILRVDIGRAANIMERFEYLQRQLEFISRRRARAARAPG
jgi:hypothetical protein